MTVATTPAVLAAVEKTALRVSLLLRAAIHPEKKACGIWSVAETAAHIVHGYPAFVGAFRGTIDVAPEQ
nr:hypothetical protein [Acidimicrobiia bacterium]